MIRWVASLVLGLAVTLVAWAEEKPAPQPKQLRISVGSTVPLQMSSKRPIAKVITDRDDVVRVTPMPDDPTTVRITGLKVGSARITLFDADGKKEERQIGKQ